MSESRSINREGDVVLIYYQENPTVYARIEAIEPDIKKDWYQVTLLFLTVPAQDVTWILREEYINGAPFTMGGQPMKVEAVERVSADRGAKQDRESPEKQTQDKPGRIIPFKKPS